MNIVFDDVSFSKEDACYSGFIVSGSVILKGPESKIDGKGILVEVIGTESVFNKKTREERTEPVFRERTPRHILTLEDNSYFRNVEIAVYDGTKLHFEVLIPTTASSSFVGEYQDYRVMVKYLMRASANINGKKIVSEIPLYMANYPFSNIDWFTPETVYATKEIEMKVESQEEVRYCCCLKKVVTKTKMKNIELTLGYIKSMQESNPLKCFLKTNNLSFKAETAKMSLNLAEIVLINKLNEKIVRVVEENPIKKLENIMNFQFSISNLSRSDFWHDGILFSRHYCLYLEYKDVSLDFDVIAEIDILSKNNYKIIKNIREDILEEKDAFKLLEKVSYANEVMY